MDTWKQKVDGVAIAIEELRTCFATISASAEGLAARLESDEERKLKGLAQDIVEISHNMDEKLSRFSQVCECLGESSLSSTGNSSVLGGVQ